MEATGYVSRTGGGLQSHLRSHSHLIGCVLARYHLGPDGHHSDERVLETFVGLPGDWVLVKVDQAGLGLTSMLRNRGHDVK